MDEINVQQPYFDDIKNGQKVIEGRLNKGKYASFKEGQVLKIKCGNKFIAAYILDVRNYKTFWQYLWYEGLAKTLPGITNTKDGCDVYYQFYTREQEEKYGVVALELYVII